MKNNYWTRLSQNIAIYQCLFAEAELICLTLTNHNILLNLVQSQICLITTMANLDTSRYQATWLTQTEGTYRGNLTRNA